MIFQMNNPTLVSPGRVALITGGGSGIGFEVARQFGLHGCKGKASGRKLALFRLQRRHHPRARSLLLTVETGPINGLF